MVKYCLKMKWEYTYDKEGTWFDRDSGQETYDLVEGADYPLPHIREKCIEIESVSIEGDTVCVGLCVDHHTVNVLNDGNPVAANASDSYCVAGDCVDQSLSLTFTIEEK